MSKHSKWAKIKRKKGVADVKRGAVFTKLTNNVTIAVKEGSGSNPTMNFKLRLAVDAARAQNVPKENIERAIARGLGKGSGTELEQLVFEGYGPGKVAVIVEVTTDSRNRSVSELKHAFSAAGGAIGGPGSVSWQFERKGVVRIQGSPSTSSGNKYSPTKPASAEVGAWRGSWDALELQLIDAGADDITTDDEVITITTPVENLKHLSDTITKLNLAVDEAALEWIANKTTTITDLEAQEKIADFLNELEEREDVTGVYINATL